MAFESDAVPGDWRSVAIVPLYKDKGERNECDIYRVINLFKGGWKNICEYPSR